MSQDSPYESTFGASLLEHEDAAPQNPTDNATMGELISQRFSRRGLLKGALAVSAISATVGTLALETAERAQAQAAKSAFAFKEVEAGVDADHHVAEGYDAQVLLRWGDPITPGAPPFDPAKQTPEAQAQQFGYNNDFVGYLPMPGAADPSAHGVLFVNHEYTNPHLMFPGVVEMKDGKPVLKNATPERFKIEAMAHGATVAEIRRTDGKWALVKDSKYNRRITVATEMQLSGPVAGTDRVRTGADASGRKVLGTLNNCSGAMTPWGTFVSGEENFHGYFLGELPADHPEAANYERVGVPAVFPADAVVFGPERVADDPRVVVQDLVVEVAPDQLREPDLGAALAGRHALPSLARQAADRERAKAQMHAQIAGALDGREVTGPVVAVNALQKVLEQGLGLVGRQMRR